MFIPVKREEDKNMNKKWIKAAGIRAVKTMAQVAAAFIAVGAAINEIEWGVVVSVSVVAGIASILTSIAGIPEVDGDCKNDEPTI